MKIIPYERVGPIEFREAREGVRHAFGPQPIVGRRSASDPMTYDLYNALGCFVYYDQQERVTSLELFRPGSAALNDVDLLAMSFVEAVGWLKTNGTCTQAEEGCRTSLDWGVSVWTGGEQMELVESVLAFEKGYFGIKYSDRR